MSACPKCGHIDPLQPRGTADQIAEIALLKHDLAAANDHVTARMAQIETLIEQRDKLLAAVKDTLCQLPDRSEWKAELRKIIAAVKP